METLHKLSDLLGPSGDEKRVRNFIKKEIKKHIKDVKIDKFGNLIAHKKGKGKKIMLAAHMDEVGLMVNEIKNNGQIKISPIGYVEPIALVGEFVFIVTGKKYINGIISYRDLHECNEIKELPYMEDLYVDTGLSKKELLKKGVNIGSYIVPTHKSRKLGNKDIIAGKALDDRIGCFILLELAKKLKKSNKDIYFVFTVQEEVGLYGAKISVYNIEPDWGIAVDVTASIDSKHSTKTKLGGGPAVTIKDAEMIASKPINDHIKKLAKKYKIPVQFEVIDIGTTDATKMMMSKGGVPSTVISVPMRNMHSTFGIAHRRDINYAITLLTKLIQNPPKLE